MGWRELQTQFINVQESVKERSGTFFLGVEHIVINESEREEQEIQNSFHI